LEASISAAVVEEEEMMDLQAVWVEMVELVVQVLSSSAIRSVNSQSKRLVEQFLTLVVRLFILLLHHPPLQSLTHL